VPQPVLTIENSMRAIRILYGLILYSIILCVVMTEKFFHHEAHDVRLIWFGFLLSGLMVVSIAAYFRFKMLQPAAETLQTSPGDRMALSRWRFGNILSFVLAESLFLFGFALRFLGGTSIQSTPFYAAAIGLMLVWWPRRP
jgi:hypothetical protein